MKFYLVITQRKDYVVAESSHLISDGEATVHLNCEEHSLQAANIAECSAMCLHPESPLWNINLTLTYNQCRGFFYEGNKTLNCVLCLENPTTGAFAYVGELETQLFLESPKIRGECTVHIIVTHKQVSLSGQQSTHTDLVTWLFGCGRDICAGDQMVIHGSNGEANN